MTYTDDEFLRRAVVNSRSHSPRWVSVTRTFACGSTVAKGLCNRYGLDPEEILPLTCSGEDESSEEPEDIGYWPATEGESPGASKLES